MQMVLAWLYDDDVRAVSLPGPRAVQALSTSPTLSFGRALRLESCQCRRCGSYTPSACPSRSRRRCACTQGATVGVTVRRMVRAWWLQGKIETIAKEIYGAGEVTYSDEAEVKIKRFSEVSAVLSCRHVCAMYCPLLSSLRASCRLFGVACSTEVLEPADLHGQDAAELVDRP